MVNVTVKGHVVVMYYRGHCVEVTMTEKGPVMTHNHASLKATGVYPPRAPKRG